MKLGFKYLGGDCIAIDKFDCGVPALNDFLRESALRFVRQGLSAVRLLIDLDTEQVIGFYAISPLSIKSKHLSEQQREAYNVAFPIPAWLIGRLAVDKSHQGSGLGQALLLDAMQNIRKRAERGAGALFIVDAKDDKVAAFYKKYGFLSLPSAHRRLVRSIADSV